VDAHLPEQRIPARERPGCLSAAIAALKTLSSSSTFGSRSGAFKSGGAGAGSAGEAAGEDATTATATDFPTPVAPLTKFKLELIKGKAAGNKS